MIELILDAFSIALVFLTFYFIMLGRHYEDEIEKSTINFFMLGLLLIVFRIGAQAAAYVGVKSYIFNTHVAAVFTILTPLCFIIGLMCLKDNAQEAAEATKNLNERAKFLKIVKKK